MRTKTESKCRTFKEKHSARRPFGFSDMDVKIAMVPVTINRHGHNLCIVHNLMECDACDRSYSGNGFSCSECKFTIHMKCVFLFGRTVVFDHPSHKGHPLMLLTTGAPDHSDPKCHTCGKNTKRLLFPCFTCNLNLDIDCMVDAIYAQANFNMFWHHHPLLQIVFGDFMACEICLRGIEVGYFCPRCMLFVPRNVLPELSQQTSLTLAMSDTLLSF